MEKKVVVATAAEFPRATEEKALTLFLMIDVHTLPVLHSESTGDWSRLSQNVAPSVNRQNVNPENLWWPIVSWGILEFRREACCLRVSSAEHHHPSMDRLFRMNPWIIITEENPLPHQHNHILHNNSFLLVRSIHYYHEDRPISRYRSCCCGCHQQCVHSSFDAIKGFGWRCRFAEKLQYVPTTNFNFKIHWDWWSF